MPGRKPYPATKTDTFNKSHIPKLQGLVMTGEDEWVNLWMNELFCRHMVVCEGGDDEEGSGEFYYVLGGTEATVDMLRLRRSGVDSGEFVGEASDFVTRSVVSIDEFVAYDFHLTFHATVDALKAEGHTALGLGALGPYAPRAQDTWP